MKYTKINKITLIILGSILVYVIIPFAIYYITRIIENAFLPMLSTLEIPHSMYIQVMGLSLVSLGFFLSAWAVYAQYKYGDGTPSPWLPPRRLVKEGPYAYSRNPMHLGNTLYTVGIGIMLYSPIFIVITLIGYGVVLTYNKLVEEKKLEEKFGEEFVHYKRDTPFLIPYKHKKARMDDK